MLNEDKTNELVSETELVDTFSKNVQWSGSPDRMWKKIQTQVKPVPWYKEYRTWLATAAAVIFIIIITNPGSNVPIPDPITNFRSIETETHGQVYSSSDLNNQNKMSLESTEEMSVQLFTRKMAPITLATEQPVVASIKVPEQVKASSTINVEIELITEHDNIISSTTPVLRLISTEPNGIMLMEVTVESWENLVLFARKPANTIIAIAIPSTPGLYELELSLGFMQDGHEMFSSKNITFQVSN